MTLPWADRTDVADGVLRVAVVGAGPAGLSVADLLTVDGGAVVDVVERLPEPFGLLRFGVAPDHPDVKAEAVGLQAVLDRDSVRLFCDTAVDSEGLSAELRQRYHAVVWATGADRDRRLGLPGEDLPGSTSAAAVVSWYNAHPEAPPLELVGHRSVAIVGAGNVALDVARMLVRDPGGLSALGVSAGVVDALTASGVRDVHLVARRGAEHAKFSLKELHELSCLAEVDIAVDRAELPAEITGPPMVRRKLALLAELAERAPRGAARRLHLNFGATPRAVLGTEAVRGLQVERRGVVEEIEADLVVRAVGYRSRQVAGVPFDVETATIPHLDHRVVRDGSARVGEYAVGWAKRGPVGILGRSRIDADETVQAILADRADLLQRR